MLEYSLKYLFKFVPLNTGETDKRETMEQTEQVVNEIIAIAGLRGPEWAQRFWSDARGLNSTTKFFIVDFNWMP